MTCPHYVAQLLPGLPSSAGRATVALPGLDPAGPDEPAWRGHLPARPPLIIPAEQSTLAAVSLVYGILAWTVLPLLGRWPRWSPGTWRAARSAAARGGWGAGSWQLPA